MVVVSNGSKIGVEFGFVGWAWIFCNGFNLGGQGMGFIFANDMAKEVNFMSSNCAFLWFEVEATGFETFEDFLEEDHVFFEGGRVDHDIVNVNIEALSNHVFKDFVHSSLKSG